ncbi:hypothetical protein HHK36_016534 [Tetracentron sinense]|uniref:Uncharacterized protein n=1 Tax=Tetracentron sinense TaxID=13715 RepID=A0A834YXE1_TETSI|nr:hypothetical protein HHK36_016534 [Tetracentron sinense]
MANEATMPLKKGNSGVPPKRGQIKVKIIGNLVKTVITLASQPDGGLRRKRGEGGSSRSQHQQPHVQAPTIQKGILISDQNEKSGNYQHLPIKGWPADHNLSVKPCDPIRDRKSTIYSLLRPGFSEASIVHNKLIAMANGAVKLIKKEKASLPPKRGQIKVKIIGNLVKIVIAVASKAG